MQEMKNLEVFAQVARSGSLTAAAAQLGLNTPAVSRILSRLEQRLQTRLFTRSTRRVVLTAEGRLLLEKVDIALAQMDEALDLLRQAKHEPSGLLRVWASAAIGKDHVLPMMAEFLRRHPKLSVEVRLDDQVPNLVTAGYDVAVHHATLRRGTNVVKRLTELPLALVASASYIAEHGVPSSPEDLAHHQCITNRSSEVHAPAWEFRRRDARQTRGTSVTVQPAGRVVIAEQFDGVLNAALCGLGITLLFAHSVTEHLKTGALKVLLPEWLPYGGGIASNNAYLWYPQRRYVSFNVRTLVDFLTERFRDPSLLEFDPYKWSAS